MATPEFIASLLTSLAIIVLALTNWIQSKRIAALHRKVTALEATTSLLAALAHWPTHGHDTDMS